MRVALALLISSLHGDRTPTDVSVDDGRYDERAVTAVPTSASFAAGNWHRLRSGAR